jgi:hypothetical protein
METEAQGIKVPPIPPTRTAVATDDPNERKKLLQRFRLDIEELNGKNLRS